jgi:ABC-type molybdate transport system substrate-binding protein
MGTRVAAALAAWLMAASLASASEPVLLHAAGSLRGALTEVGGAFEAATQLKVLAKFGASGLLKDEIMRGERAEVFASANMDHPRALQAAGRSGPVVLFTRNELCALVRPGLDVTSATLLDRMLDPSIKVGTSTPRADPSGDYAVEVFRKAETLKPGAAAALERKALQLTGGPTSPQPPADRNLYGALVAQGAADLFLTYCTGAAAAIKENAGQTSVALPPSLAVGADYGLTVMLNSQPDAYRLAMFILSTEGQKILARYGFGTPTLPK